MLSISVLGPLVIGADGARALKMPRKARALLVYLAMHNGERVPRDRLADLLWPYQDTEQARHSLRNCLLEVRKASECAREWLGGDFGHCWLTDVTLDVTRFELQHRSVDRVELREACAVYRGEFLEGFELPSEPWGEWVTETRGRLQDNVVAALTRLSELCSAAGEHDEAIAAARRLVVLDPFGERSHQRLMRALQAQHAEAASLLSADGAGAEEPAEPGMLPPAGVASRGAEGRAPLPGPEAAGTFVRSERKVGRNEPCPCGSGKKYKHCHGALE